MSHAIVVHQPEAGEGGVSRDDLTSILEAAGHVVTYLAVDERGWEEAVRETADVVVVAGGDGTLRKAFAALHGRSTPVSVVPLGTANNVARTLGIPTAEPVHVPTRWPAAAAQPFDLPLASTRRGTTPFVESVGGGLFADLLVDAERGDEGAPDSKHEGLAKLSERLRAAPPRHWQLSVDDRRHDGDYLAVEIMNIREIGPNVPVAPHADPGDGLVDVVLVEVEHRDPLLAYLADRLAGRLTGPPPVRCERGRTVAAIAPAGTNLHADDRPWTATSDDEVVQVTVPDRPRLDVLR